ncbi:hypothetical protein A0H76_2531 [Hepatospora eriocheir]|uniref:Uncharacterized protein n=1 Tax=Hepatospora eriocheir TaxID=1081669 RepID=A0A1X0QF68_9MICR|nr:hypothetical protein A0H76_2531 [Hepatospora eriocheir]
MALNMSLMIISNLKFTKKLLSKSLKLLIPTELEVKLNLVLNKSLKCFTACILEFIFNCVNKNKLQLSKIILNISISQLWTINFNILHIVLPETTGSNVPMYFISFTDCLKSYINCVISFS